MRQQIKQGLQKLVQALKWLWQQLKRISKWIWEYTLGPIVRRIEEIAEENRLFESLKGMSASDFLMQSADILKQWLDLANSRLGIYDDPPVWHKVLAQVHSCQSGRGAVFVHPDGTRDTIVMFYVPDHAPLRFKAIPQSLDGNIVIGDDTAYRTYKKEGDKLVDQQNKQNTIPMNQMIPWSFCHGGLGLGENHPLHNHIVILQNDQDRNFLLCFDKDGYAHRLIGPDETINVVSDHTHGSFGIGNCADTEIRFRVPGE